MNMHIVPDIYLTIEALVLVDPLAFVLVGGDDGHHLVAAELLELRLSVWMLVLQVAPEPLQVL